MMNCSQPSTVNQPAPDLIWDLIAPAVPDRLNDLGGGVYEALWWKPVPVMDVEIMRRDECVELLGAPFEPAQLPGGVGLHFRVSPPRADQS